MLLCCAMAFVFILEHFVRALLHAFCTQEEVIYDIYILDVHLLTLIAQNVKQQCNNKTNRKWKGKDQGTIGNGK